MASELEGPLKENVVEYRLFTTVPDEMRAGDDTTRFLCERRDLILAYVGRFCINHIWQVEPFTLRVISGTGGVPMHLAGNTCYGENVEDEWFIVWLLMEISKEFSDLVISVQDSDGEFLLIEAADHLPKWLNPDSAENRVFIHRGKLHIVPRSFAVSSVAETVSYVRLNYTTTLASNGVQQALSRRITGFPGKNKESLHRANCYLPAALAAALDHSPALIAPIVHAFYHRDPIDLQACVTFKHFRPGTRVMHQVVFTRCLYAQLLQQQFCADRRSGYTLPPANNPKFKAHELGMKLAHGAEILCSKFNLEDVSADNSDFVVKSDPSLLRFIAALKSKGYFRNEVEGSKLYQKLYDDAVKFYKASVRSSQSENSDDGRRLLGTIKSATFDIEQMRQKEKELPPSDDDSWININADQLDELLNNISGRSATTVTDLDLVAQQMKSFVDKVSSYEGAEFAGGDDDIQLDAGSFMQSMQKVFEFEDTDSASSSDMDEYESEEEFGDGYPSSRSKAASKASKPSKVSKVAAGKPSSTTKAKPVPPAKPSVPIKPNVKSKQDDTGKYLGMQEYMQAMDRELAKTTIGKSFVREGDDVLADNHPKPPPRRNKAKPNILVTPNNTPVIPSGFPAAAAGRSNVSHPKHVADDDIDDEDDEFRPVNVDLNAVKNLLESYESQQGLPGPVSSMLGGMGMRLPPPSDKI